MQKPQENKVEFFQSSDDFMEYMEYEMEEFYEFFFPCEYREGITYDDYSL